MRAGTKLLGGALAAGASLALVAWVAGGGGGAAPGTAPIVAQAPAPAAPVAAPPSAPARPIAAPAAPAAAPAPAPSPAEDDHLARLRVEADAHPALGVQLADEGERRFPGGPHAPERAYLKMRALVHLGDIGAARDAAAEFFKRHPRDPLGQYVWRLTGMRPKPSPFPRW